MTSTPEDEIPARQGTGWDADEEQRLYTAFVDGRRVADIAEAHERRTGAIRAHLQKLGLLDELGATVEPRPDYAPTAAALKRSEKLASRTAVRAARKPDAEGDGKTELNPQFAEALRLMTESDELLFITGKAGTGKSTLLRHFRRTTKKNVVVLAPTGIAALNVGGQTIHHFFRFSIDVTPHKIAARKKPRNAKLYKKLDVVVIDEVSMVRADILDCIEIFLRLHGPHPGQPFGGVRMVFIGDLYQLPPVVGQQERDYFSDIYQTPYFFSSQSIRDLGVRIVELEKVYRQKDQAFVALLNRVRNNTVTADDIDRLNSRYDASTAISKTRFSISLTATNKRADEINAAHLAALSGRTFHAAAEVRGEFGREYFPASPELAYKVGAQIMLLNNDRDGRWVNGSIGVIDAVKKDVDGRDYVSVTLRDSDEPVAVYPHKWEVYQFALADSKIESEPVGTFEQYPFRLAWAVTIHKSQGKTFERVTIDIGAGAFAGGQVYVALSRCTSFEGITLKTPLQRKHIHTDPRIHAFMAAHEAREQAPQDTVIALIERAIRDGALLDIVYQKADGEQTTRSIYPRELGRKTYQGQPFLGMKAYCTSSNQDLLFSLDRIIALTRAA